MNVQAAAALLAKSQPCDVDIDKKMDLLYVGGTRFCILHLGEARM